MASPDKPGIKFITNVSEFGIFLPLARTRARLIISVIVANTIMFALTWWVSGYIIDGSASVTLNLGLIALCMLALVAASYLEAMLLGDVFFPGNWRERVLLGKKEDLDLESSEIMRESRYRNYNLAFLVVVALSIVANYIGLNMLTGDFMDEYHNVGFHLTQLRSTDADEKVTALRELAKPTNRHLWTDARVTAAITSELDNTDEPTRQWAIWAAGEMKMSGLYTPLTQQLERDEPATRAAAAVALGKLGDPRAQKPLDTFLASSFGDKEQALGALRGIALLGEPEPGPTVKKFAAADHEEVRAHAFWALGMIGYKPARKFVLERLEEGTANERCGALESLKYLANTEDVQTFRDRFLLEADTDQPCEWLVWEDRNEKKTFVVYKESFRVKYMKIVWNATQRTADAKAIERVRQWFYNIAADKEMPYPIRAQASDIVEVATHEMKERSKRPK